jgi:hypothetical protein
MQPALPSAAASSASLSVQLGNLSLSEPVTVRVDAGTLSGPVDIDFGTLSGSGALSRFGTLNPDRAIDLGSLTSPLVDSSTSGPLSLSHAPSNPSARGRSGTLVAPVSFSQSAARKPADNPMPIPAIYGGLPDDVLGIQATAAQTSQAVSSPIAALASAFAPLSISVSQASPSPSQPQTFLPPDSPRNRDSALESKAPAQPKYVSYKDKRASITKRASISKKASLSTPPQQKRAESKRKPHDSDSDLDSDSDTDSAKASASAPKAPAENPDEARKKLILTYQRNKFAKLEDLYGILDACRCDLSKVEEYDRDIAVNLVEALKVLKHFDFFQLEKRSLRNDIDAPENYYFVTQKQIAFVRKYCPELQSVNLSNLRFTSGAHVEINRLCLKELCMEGTLGLNASQVRPQRIKGLEVLDVSHNFCVNDTWLQGLKGCKLRVLKLSQCREVTASGLEVLYSLDSLRELHIGGLGYPVPDLKPEFLRRVEVINLCGANVTDSDLLQFLKAPALTTLQLSSCNQISLDGLEGLLEQRSGLREVDVRRCSEIEKEPHKVPFVCQKFSDRVKVRTFFDELTSLERQDKLIGDILRQCPNFSDSSMLKALPKQTVQLMGQAGRTCSVLDLRGMTQSKVNFDLLKNYFINLRTLSFANGSMSLELLANLKEYFPRVEHLNISGLTVQETETVQVADPDFKPKAPAKAGEKPKFKAIKIEVVKYKTFNKDHLKLLVKGCPPLRSLNLDGTHVTGRAIRELRNEPALQNLTFLSLGSCPQLFQSDAEDGQLFVPKKLRVLNVKGTPDFTTQKRETLQQQYQKLVILQV